MRSSRKILKFFQLPIITGGAIIRMGVLIIFLIILGVWFYANMLRMPGKSYRGPLPSLTKQEKMLARELQEYVYVLSSEIGERNVNNISKLIQAQKYLESVLESMGYIVSRQVYDVNGVTVANLEVQRPGSINETVVIGAHYDSLEGTLGANDNASGVAATLVLAKVFANRQPDRTLKFVFFINEESPYFQTEKMGSRVYAKRSKQRNENIVAMLSLETIGYYSDRPNTQKYPLNFLNFLYPDTGNFIGFVSNIKSVKLLRKVIKAFRQDAQFPSEGGALPGNVTGIGWSDHWPFWQEGYPAIMVTDSAPFRYPYYHTREDSWDKIDYEKMARVVEGLELVVKQLISKTNQ